MKNLIPYNNGVKKSWMLKRKTMFTILFLALLLTGIVAGRMIFAFEEKTEKKIKISWFSTSKRVEKNLDKYAKIIRKDKNYIIHSGSTNDMQYFYRSLDSLTNHLRRKVNIIHIGDSHVQADAFPGKVRENFQKDSLFGNGGRGILFPHSLTRSNNALSVKVNYNGIWQGCKNAEWGKACNWGLTGVIASTQDVNAGFAIDPNTLSPLSYEITKIKVFYPVNDATSYEVKINSADAEIKNKIVNQQSGYVEFQLSHPIREVSIGLEKTSDLQKSFVLQGISLEDEKPGIIYHSSGINGVDTYGYLRSPMLEQHITALKPDLIIISLGTNDAYTRKFDAITFKRNYGTLIQRVRRASPKASILLTTPGDCLLYRRYPNYNNALAGKILKDLAEETGCAVWDFYEVMGGMKSINVWFYNGLALWDKLHFNGKGYYLQGDLLYDALTKDYVAFSAKHPLQKIEITGR